MDYLEFERELASLHCGQLRLKPPGENGMTEVAFGWFGDLKRYITALETGYRVVCEALDGYRKQERTQYATSGKLVRELQKKQWSEGACLGYAVMGLRGANFKPDEAVRVLEAMGEAMELYDLETAARAHQDLIDGRREYEMPLHPSPSATPSALGCQLQEQSSGNGKEIHNSPPDCCAQGEGSVGDGGADCHGKHGGQGKREQRQQPGGLLRAVADGYAGSDNPCICADSGRPTPRNDRDGGGGHG